MVSIRVTMLLYGPISSQLQSPIRATEAPGAVVAVIMAPPHQSMVLVAPLPPSSSVIMITCP